MTQDPNAHEPFLLRIWGGDSQPAFQLLGLVPNESHGAAAVWFSTRAERDEAKARIRGYRLATAMADAGNRGGDDGTVSVCTGCPAHSQVGAGGDL